MRLLFGFALWEYSHNCECMNQIHIEVSDRVDLSLLVENTARGAGIIGEHGLCWCLRSADRQLLFDLGQGFALCQNAARMGIDLKQTEVLAFSHGHYDHVGGWRRLPEVLAKVRVCLHPDALDAKFQKRPDGRMVTAGDNAFAAAVQSSHVALTLTREPCELLPGIWITGQVPRTNSVEDTGGDFYSDIGGFQRDEVLDDQSIFFRTRLGVVVVLGCAHAGLVNTLDYVQSLTGERIHAVVGGMHLLHANEERMQYTVEGLRRIAPDWLGPNHCTGDAAVARLWQSFPGQVIEVHAGQSLSFPMGRSEEGRHDG